LREGCFFSLLGIRCLVPSQRYNFCNTLYRRLMDFDRHL